METKRPPEQMTCPECDSTAFYEGTQDGHSVYVCVHKHLTRIKVEAKKEDS